MSRTQGLSLYSHEVLSRMCSDVLQDLANGVHGSFVSLWLCVCVFPVRPVFSLEALGYVAGEERVLGQPRSSLVCGLKDESQY